MSSEPPGKPNYILSKQASLIGKENSVNREALSFKEEGAVQGFSGEGSKTHSQDFTKQGRCILEALQQSGPSQLCLSPGVWVFPLKGKEGLASP